MSTVLVHDSIAPAATRTEVAEGRHVDIDRTKALVIVFVVLGHIADPRGPVWATDVQFLIYNFHMPLFMYLSGFVFFMQVMRGYRGSMSDYIASRAKRLLVPFLVMGVVTINIKFASRGFVHLARPDFSYLDGYKTLIVNTNNGPALYLWYLATLFVFSVFTFVTLRASRASLNALMLLSVALYAYFALNNADITDDFYLIRICWFYIFFMVGCFAALHWSRWEDLLRRLWPVAMLGLAVYEAGALYDVAGMGSVWRFLFCGLLSIVAIHGMMLRFKGRLGGILDLLSANTLIIYLLNTTIISAGMPILQKFGDLSSRMWLAYAVLVPLGIVLPIAFRESLKRLRLFPGLMPYIT